MSNSKVPGQLPCLSCKGTGTYKLSFSEVAFKCGCYSQTSDGMFPEPDLLALSSEVVSKRGWSKGHVRLSAPKHRMDDLKSCRVYYLWRMFRFHAGKDVTMPVVAGMVLHYDPYHREIDMLAEAMASKATGRVSQGSLRWGHLLGTISDSEMQKLEKSGQVGDSARECGPAFDSNKPPEEELEKK